MLHTIKVHTGLFLVSIFLVACGGGSSGGIAGIDTQETSVGGSCTYIIDRDITSPTRLVNSGAGCDYLLDGWVNISSTLSIEPGVVIVAAADARLVVDGGQIQARGTAQNRIVFQGASPITGFWRGLQVQEGGASAFDYVDIKDAGQVCTILFCPDGGFIVDESALSFTNSSVSNSSVHGMIIYKDVQLTSFSNNRFYGNKTAGLAINGENAPMLDRNSDYAGAGNPNGSPYVHILPGDQERGEVFRWKKLGAAYHIGSYYSVKGGTLYLEAGVDIVFAAEAWLDITGNGVLQSMGTAASPNSLTGVVKRAGYWDGVKFRRSPWNINRLMYTTIAHSGDTSNLSPAYGAVSLNQSHVLMTGNTIEFNARWGIYCSDFGDASVITDGGGNGFRENASGHLTSDCVIRDP